MSIPRVIILVGLMGTGKSTVARELAQRFGAECLDTDKIVETRAGKSVRAIFDEDGEDVFRDHESQVLQQCLLSSGPVVVAGAGGVVVRKENREALKKASHDGTASVVWLHAPPDVLVQRTQKGAHRPLLDNDREGTLRKMAADRSSWYSEVADIVVDVSSRSPESVAALIVDALSVGDATSGGSNE